MFAMVLTKTFYENVSRTAFKKTLLYLMPFHVEILFLYEFIIINKGYSVFPPRNSKNYGVVILLNVVQGFASVAPLRLWNKIMGMLTASLFFL